MGEPKLPELNERDKAVCELLAFVGDFARLMDQQIADARGIMLKTVDQMMESVTAINAAADHKLRMADEVLVKEASGREFVSKSAKEIDPKFADPAGRVKAINEQISSHMASLTNLDESVRSVLFSIMGALSMDDVIRQRLEHVTTSTHAMQTGVTQIIKEFSMGTLSESVVEDVKSTMANVMYKSFTMEDEKSVFKAILGDVKNFRKS